MQPEYSHHMEVEDILRSLCRMAHESPVLLCIKVVHLLVSEIRIHSMDLISLGRFEQYQMLLLDELSKLLVVLLVLVDTL